MGAGVGARAAGQSNSSAGRDFGRGIGGEAIDFDRLADHLPEADIIICSTAADEYVITEQMAREALARRRNRPSFFIDISVPRNIDPGVGKLSNVFVFDIDDLESVISSNIREREREAERAELIVESETMQFQQTLRVMDIGPTIGALRNKLHDIAQAGAERVNESRLGPLSAEQEAAIEALLVSTVNKISHPLLSHMRRSFDASDADAIQAWRDIFGLEE